MNKQTGSCHCGAVAFEVEGDIEKVVLCNCSICTKKGYLHWIVPQQRFRLLRGAGQLTTYTFNTGVAQHHFCRICGVAPYYVPRSDPDKIDINVRCVDAVDVQQLQLESFDGRNWEAAYQTYRR
jgi:hypothetical protein